MRLTIISELGRRPEFMRNMPPKEFKRLSAKPEGDNCDKCGTWSSYWDTSDHIWNKLPMIWRHKHLCRRCFKQLALSESVVATARADIMNICNEIASNIAQAAVTIFGKDTALRRALSFSEPKIDHAQSEDEPAMVTLRLGSRAQETITVTIFGDGGGEIKLEMSEHLSSLLKIPPRAILSSMDEVIRKFGDIAATVKDKLEGRNVNHQNQPQT